MHGSRAWMLAAAAGLAVAGPAWGQDKTWDGGGGSTDWFADLNWDPDGVPGSSDAVLVQGVVPVAQAADIDVRTLFADTGLVLDSRSMFLAEPSTITGFTLRGCCTRSITTQQLLTLNGVTTLSKGTIFGGPGGARILGMATSAEIVRVNGTRLTIAGSLVASGNVEPWSGGVVDVTGTLALRAPGDLDEVSGGATELSAGGQIGMLGATANDQVLLDARLTAGAGTLFADRGILDLRGEYDLAFTTVEANDGGQVWFGGSFPNEVADVSFTGDGTVELRNANNVYSGALSADMPTFGKGLKLVGTTRLDGFLTNSGYLSLGSLLTSPAGTGRLLTNGRLEAGGTIEIPVAVTGGGIIDVGNSLTMKADVDVLSGGELWLGSASSSGSITRPSGQSARIYNGGVVWGKDDQNCTQRAVTISVPMDLLPGGLVNVESGELVLNGGGDWSGGMVAPASNCLGRVSVTGFNITHTVSGEVIARASAAGSINIGGNSHTLNVTGTLRTEGVAENPTSGIVLTGRTIGAGQIVHQLEQLKLGSGFDLGTTLVNEAAVKVEGSIQVRGELRNEVDGEQHATMRFEGGTLINDGNWVVRASADQQLGAGGMITNTGVYQAGFDGAGGIGHRSFVRFDNAGVVVAHDADVELHDVAQVVNNELVGGGWVTLGAGTISFPGTAVTRVRGSGTVVDGDTTSQPWMSGVTDVDDGSTVNVTGDAVFGAGLGIDGGTVGVGDGVVFDTGGDLDLHSVTSDLQGVISLALLPAPATIVAGETRSRGRIMPGGTDRAGQFDFVGALTMFDGGELQMEIGGEGNTDVVTVAGPVTLGGTLRVSFIDGFEPVGGESYRLIDTLGGVFLDFGAVELPELPQGLEWELYTGELFVGLAVIGDACEADWNGDGSVNTLDFLAYLGDWSAGDLAADLNGDGTVNTLDFLAYLGLWSAGC